MTQHKVISDDSMSAMDEISKVLGKDAVIISTKKNNGKIEIVGSNDIKHILKTKKIRPKIEKKDFKKLFSNQPLSSSSKNILKNNDPEGKNILNNDISTLKSEFKNFKNEIENLLSTMIITDIEKVLENSEKNDFLTLLKKGCPKEIIYKIFNELEQMQINKNISNFYDCLASKLISNTSEKIKLSSKIFVTGLSGVGKTVLSAKLASNLLEYETSGNKAKVISLINLSKRSTNKSSDLINYGRLLNVNVHSFCDIKDFKAFIEVNDESTLIIDVSKDYLRETEFLDLLNKSLNYINSSLILAVQSGVNKKSLKEQLKILNNFNPIVTLTKLDETLIGIEELTAFVELKSKIGLLSSSKNIMERLAFAKKEILAQYMKGL